MRISAFAPAVLLLAITLPESAQSQDDPFRTSPLPVAPATRPTPQQAPPQVQPPRPRRETAVPTSRVCDSGGATTSDAGGIVGMRNMRVSQGHNCFVRFLDGPQRDVRVDLAPRNGRVEVSPDGYRYVANSNYVGQDSFSVSRQGPRGRIRSDVVVEVVR